MRRSRVWVLSQELRSASPSRALGSRTGTNAQRPRKMPLRIRTISHRSSHMAQWCPVCTEVPTWMGDSPCEQQDRVFHSVETWAAQPQLSFNSKNLQLYIINNWQAVVSAASNHFRCCLLPLPPSTLPDEPFLEQSTPTFSKHWILQEKLLPCETPTKTYPSFCSLHCGCFTFSHRIPTPESPRAFSPK